MRLPTPGGVMKHETITLQVASAIPQTATASVGNPGMWSLAQGLEQLVDAAEIGAATVIGSTFI